MGFHVLVMKNFYNNAHSILGIYCKIQNTFFSQFLHKIDQGTRRGFKNKLYVSD